MANIVDTSSSTQENIEKALLWRYWQSNPVAWAESCVFGPEVGGAASTIKFYEPQAVVLNSFYEDHYIIMNKSRQTGGSFITQIVVAHLVMFYENVIIGVISRDGDEATDFALKVKNIIQNAKHEWTKPKYEINNRQNFILKNGSGVYTETINPKNPGAPFRGKSITLLIIDEAAHIPLIDKAYTSIAPTLSNTKVIAKAKNIPYGIIVISTPNGTAGIGEWYYGMWVGAKDNPDTIWKPHAIHWREIPKYAEDPAWYKEQCSILNNDPRRIGQELEMEFISSSDVIFDDVVQRGLSLIKLSPTTKTLKINKENGTLHIFKEIDKNRTYVIGIDTASESGKDYSTVQVLDYLTQDQIMEYKGKLEPKKFADVVRVIADLVPRNVIVIERTGGFGLTVIHELKFDKTRTYNLFGEYKVVAGSTELGKKFLEGLETNKKTRPLIMEALYNHVVNNLDCIKSERLARELLCLVNKNGKIQAQSGFNDDLCMALGFTCYVKAYGKYRYPGSYASDMEAMYEGNFEENNEYVIEEVVPAEIFLKSLEDDRLMGYYKDPLDRETTDFVDDFINEINLNYTMSPLEAAMKTRQNRVSRDKFKKLQENMKDRPYATEEERLEDEMYESGLLDMD